MKVLCHANNTKKFVEWRQVMGMNDLIEAEPTKKKSKIFKNIIEFFWDLTFYICIIIVITYIVPNFILQRTIVDGSSMNDTLSHGDNLYVEKISHHFNKLNRFDVIVFYPFGKDGEENDYYVKRIIGMPGETIQIKEDGSILINGDLLNENYGRELILNSGRAEGPITIGEDEYFVLGDNRNASEDSRSERIGTLS